MWKLTSPFSGCPKRPAIDHYAVEGCSIRIQDTGEAHNLPSQRTCGDAMISSLPQPGRLILAVLILGFCSLCTIPDACASSYEDTLLKAVQGDSDAQFNLARLCLACKDVPQNYIDAYAWTNLAAIQGHLEGEKLLSRLTEIMTSQQIMEGKALTAQIEISINKREKDGAFSLEKHVALPEPRYQSDSSSREIARDGRFIAYANGTVFDTCTGLMWADRDNGKEINWYDAKKYCENYIGGWHDDWRMPTQDELAMLYDTGPGYPQECCSSCSEIKITELIHLSCGRLWTSETDGSGAAHFVFRNGFRGWNYQADYVISRVLPVREVARP